MALIDAHLQEILTCPCLHRAALEENAPASQLVCARCHLAFSVEDGLPIMMLQDAIVTPEYDAAQCGAPELVGENAA